VLTARVDEEGKLNFLRLGIDDYLTKPFNEEELLIRIENCINNYTTRNNFVEEEKIAPVENKELIQIEEIINQNISDTSFSVSRLADILNLSERSLYRKIKSITGLTPNAFIREIKLIKAQTMCSNQEVSSIKELAKILGFTNSGHFARLFEKRFGKKPL
jgi:AraC-like DNA-binding protein